MRAAAILPLTLALVTAAASAPAQSKIRVPSVKGRLGEVFRAERRTTVTALDLASLPLASSSPLLDDSKKPAALPGALAEASEVQFVSNDAAAQARWKASRGTQPMYGRLEVAGGTVRLARDVQSGIQRGGAFSVSCYTEGGAATAYNAYRAVAVRWERVVPAAGNQPATLHTADGWFDSASCKVYLERRQSAPLQVAAAFEGIPVVFANRTDEGLALYFPPAARVAADTTAGVSSPTPGVLWRVSVPVRKGLAASVLAEVSSAAAASWMLQATAGPVGPAGSNATAPVVRAGSAHQLQIGVDVVQAVRDEQPTILVRLTS